MARRGRDLERGAMSSPERGSQSRVPADPWANYAGTGRQSGDAGCAVPGNVPPGFCTQLGPGSGGLGTVPVLPGDATRVRVPSSPGESSSNGRPVAKARGVDPVMSVPFVQGSLFQQQTPVGNMEPMSVMMAQMNQMMQTMSTFQSEVSNRLAVLERRENLQQTVLTGVENPQSFGESYASGQGGSFNRLGSPIRERHSNRDEVDVFSKSEKWLPNPPTPDTKSWTTREQEIEGLYSYIQALRSWSMLASERLANEISQAMSWPEEIITSALTPGQQARSAKLFALLRTAFAAHPRVDALIRAFEAGAPTHNSPMKPFGSCGFELLRVLGLEFSLRTRTEAICSRSEVMRKDFRIDARGTHVVSDLLRAMAVETSRYDKLISTLPPTVPRTDLLLNESDQALILIRNLPADARQYVLLHAQDDGLTALREAGLKYERQQRLYSELGAVAGKLRQVQEGESVLNLTMRVLWMPLERVTGPNVVLSVGNVMKRVSVELT